MFDERREQRDAEDHAIDDRERPDAQDVAQDEVGGVPTMMVGIELNEAQRPVIARILAEGEGRCGIFFVENYLLVRDGDTEWMVDETGLAQREELPF